MNINLGNDVEFQLVDNTKFLGVYVDETLRWTSHVEATEKKLNSVCYTLRVLGNYLDFRTLKIIYYSNFESILRYGIIFYGHSNSLQRLFIVQKRALRCMLKIRHRESCRGKFSSNKLLTITAIYIQEILLFVFKNRQCFQKFLPTNYYPTRNFNYRFPVHHLTLTEKNVEYSCIKIFNHLPLDLKIVTDLTTFKKKIHKMLIDLEPYCLEDYFK
nr:unnamed protein product [Callosobruchus analis]